MLACIQYTWVVPLSGWIQPPCAMWQHGGVVRRAKGLANDLRRPLCGPSAHMRRSCGSIKDPLGMLFSHAGSCSAYLSLCRGQCPSECCVIADRSLCSLQPLAAGVLRFAGEVQYSKFKLLVLHSHVARCMWPGIDP